MFNLKRGDIDRIVAKSGVPYSTVRRYVHGLSKVNFEAARKVDAAYAEITAEDAQKIESAVAELKPAQVARRAQKEASRKRRASAPVRPEGAAPAGAVSGGAKGCTAKTGSKANG